MKKLFTLTIMLITLSMNAQDYGHVSNPVVDVAIFKGSDAQGIENALTVPEGVFITFNYENGDWKWAFPDGTTPGNDNGISISYTVLPEGYKFYYPESQNNANISVSVHEYASSGSTFSYSEAELDNSVKLFPNPTTSEVALNSEKTYEIEVFDILGNKVMELVGNSINMEHLSHATYIVNALDVESQESLSYKVIKK
jgi:hypothetical protein